MKQKQLPSICGRQRESRDKAMKKAKQISSRIICAILCVMCFCAVFPATALAANETETVRVGFFAFDGYHMQDEDGIRSGYGYDLLGHIAGYAGFRYEYVGFDKSWSEMQDMLAGGEIDILTGAPKTDEALERFDFSSKDVGISATILTTMAENDAYQPEAYNTWNGLRIGMVEGAICNDGLARYAKEHHFSYEPVYFTRTEEMLAALKTDASVDVILTSNLRPIEGERIIAQFDSSPFYIMVQKGNTALLEKVNDAITQMDAYEPGFRTKLFNDNYLSKDGSNLFLSAEEQQFIKDMRDTTFTALLSPDRAPYSFTEDGLPAGSMHDAAVEIIARSGLNVEFVVPKDRSEYWQLINSGAIDIRFDAESNYNEAELLGYWQTSPYLEVPITRLYREDAALFDSAAILRDSDIAASYVKALSSQGISVTYYDSVADVAEAVLNGKQSMALLPQNTAAIAVRDDQTNHLASEPMYGYSTAYAVTVNMKCSPFLFSILNKAVSSLNKQDMDAFDMNYWDDLQKPFSLIGYVYDYPLHIVMFVAGIMFVLLLIFGLVASSRRKRAALAQVEQIRHINEQLQEALGRVEKADAAKSQFLSRVSHEMRTPLNAIIGFIELARDAQPEKMATYLASCNLASKQLLNVINDVLDMSSIESGKLKIANESFNFRHVITSITNIYGTQCKQKGIDFEAQITTPVDDWLVGDELRVNQILINLLGNAVKFTNKGHIHLTISETLADADKVFIRFSVSDTGCGMSEQMKERLFQPFEQESVTTARKFGGSGLGLSIVKSLVSMMKGTIRVESKLGEGTTFIVDLPFERSDVVQEIILPQTLETLRVLVVDDEATEREYMGLVLERMGIRFACVSSGREALDALRESERENEIFNVCLVDWRMPEMDGLDTTGCIRAEYGKDVVVIVVSAYNFQQTDDSLKKAGANLFLSKPIFQSSLFDLFMSLTGGNIAKPSEDIKVWDFAGKRVLLVEDNELNQIVARGYLAKFNIVVELAENGRIAVDMFQAAAPGYYDAILMDIQMPVMDGFEAAKAIRKSAHPEAKTVQIIAQTADAFTEDITHALSCGMNDHVAKPIKPDVLAKALYKAFYRKNV